MSEKRIWACDKCGKAIEGIDNKYSLKNINISKGSSNGGGRVLIYESQPELDFCGMSCILSYIQDGLAADKG